MRYFAQLDMFAYDVMHFIGAIRADLGVRPLRALSFLSALESMKCVENGREVDMDSVCYVPTKQIHSSGHTTVLLKRMHPRELRYRWFLRVRASVAERRTLENRK